MAVAQLFQAAHPDLNLSVDTLMVCAALAPQAKPAEPPAFDAAPPLWVLQALNQIPGNQVSALEILRVAGRPATTGNCKQLRALLLSMGFEHVKASRSFYRRPALPSPA